MSIKNIIKKTLKSSKILLAIEIEIVIKKIDEIRVG